MDTDADKPRQRGWRADIALTLLDNDKALANRSVVVAGSAYGGNQEFVLGLITHSWDFLVELPPSIKLSLVGSCWSEPACDLLPQSDEDLWSEVSVTHPMTHQTLRYACAHIGSVLLPNGAAGNLWVIQTGAIHGLHPGTIFILTSLSSFNLQQAVVASGWSRWIKSFIRQQSRPIRQNIAVMDRSLLDYRFLPQFSVFDRAAPALAANATLNIVELFAGAGGMGLGFLMANDADSRYRILFSGEVHPVYVETLRRNHQAYIFADDKRSRGLVPSEYTAIDLRSNEAFELAQASVAKVGRPDVLIGGPPCQGFSNANRNSGHGENKNNRLVDTYVEYVKKLTPKVFIMENVQGILSSTKPTLDKPLSVLEYVAAELRAAGYLVFPKLIDAAWFGVPQHRQRFFVIGIHDDLGFSKGDFGSWGPFPSPTHGPDSGKKYVSVREAIQDLPSITNGASETQLPYIEPTAGELVRNEFLALMRRGAAKGTISDHVTSKHAAYVIERYKLIPEGSNWQSIVEHLSNYADVTRTHSNIYRRLSLEYPSITIGHYRKSMLVHPTENRGLSLREASRLQSFPDWFRFAGAADGESENLGHKQQQLANAVCPLVSTAIAEYIYRLILQSNCGTA